MSSSRITRLLVATAVAVAAGATLAVTQVGAAPAPAAVTAATIAGDGCYTWPRVLSAGASGSDVTRLQIRVAGWVASGEVLGIDGQYGPATTRAVSRFQSAYGLGADGVAGNATFAKIYELQDNDCTPIHFSYAEANNNCGRGGDFSGGAVSAATVKENLLRAMWKAEALRRKLGDRAIGISSGFRDRTCNASVGGATNSRHLYGDALDLVPGPSLCAMAQGARSAGFSHIFGPGYPNHNDHTHVDSSAGQNWQAPNCGI
jgi:zinc D-Ala-D-Ala carboxypeptidase